MRRLFLPIITLLVFTACRESENKVTPKEQEDEGVVVELSDPGKIAETCYPSFEDNELNVVTWNIEFFPINGDSTINKVTAIVEELDADIIAVQEIVDGTDFIELGDGLEGWKAVYSDVRYSQEIGFLYKQSAFTSFGELSQLFGDDSNAFPRQAVRLDLTHMSGLEVTFLNIHLKCCGGDGSNEQDQREAASIRMKTYIDENLSDRAVIILGDFNDGISQPKTPFQNFKDDTNYRFVDQEIADGAAENWSYPSWPSHLDHILVSDELFDRVRNVLTILPEDCITSYEASVSDHRPVLASFK